MSVEGKRFYRFDYLKSEHWQNLRLAKLAEVDACCQRCGIRDTSNDVHHLLYRQLYDVQPIDLIVLCRECHNEVHRVIEETRVAIENGEPAREATWFRFLKLWNNEPHKLRELGLEIARMRKAGLTMPIIRNKPQPIDCFTLRLPVDVIAKSRIKATQQGMKLSEWMEKIIGDASE